MTTQHPAEAFAERVRDEIKHLDLHGWTQLVGTIDLVAFQGMTSEGRRRIWAVASESDKLGLVLQILRAKGEQLDSDVILGWLSAMEERFGASPIEASVAAALERLAEENAAHARAASKAGEKEDAAFFRRAANAYLRALEQWQAGVRPERTATGGWRLPSKSDGQPHLLTMDGDWTCSCRAGASMHWAKALIIGLEVAEEDANRLDDGPPEQADHLRANTPAPVYDVIIVERCSARTLGERLALARRALMVA